MPGVYASLQNPSEEGGLDTAASRYGYLGFVSSIDSGPQNDGIWHFILELVDERWFMICLKRDLQNAAAIRKHIGTQPFLDVFHKLGAGPQ